MLRARSLLCHMENCRYIKRRTREYFRKEIPKDSVAERLNFAKEQLDVVKRQSIVYGLYSRRGLRNIMVSITSGCKLKLNSQKLKACLCFFVPSGIERSVSNFCECQPTQHEVADYYFCLSFCNIRKLVE